MSWPASGSGRVRRGGSWRGAPRGAQVAFRSYDAPGIRDHFLGLRLARRCT